MNYIETINQFWKQRRSKRITNLQADLYGFLLQESSSRGSGNNWENPFQCANGTICSAIGISEKSLIDARNVLQQLGLIEFENGVTKQKSPVYYLPEYWNKVSNPVSIRGGKQGGNPVSIGDSNPVNIIKEETKRKQKRNETGEGKCTDVPPLLSFKNWTEEDFKQEMLRHAEKYPKDLRIAFFKYWKERSAGGKMKFQLERTWETELRLENWHRRQTDFDNQKTTTNGSTQQFAGKTTKQTTSIIGEGGFGEL